MWLYGRHVGQLLGPKNGITAKFDGGATTVTAQRDGR
jgi:hypothetical protein